MKNNHIRLILTALLTLFATLQASSAVKLDVKLDSVHLVMGRTTTLHLDVTKPGDVKGNLTLFNEINQHGLIPVCGDSVEFRNPRAVDTIVSGDNVTIKYEITVQAFDSGYYRLPELLYVSGNDTSRSKQLSLKVVPVQAKADDQINDYASVADPENKSIFDYLPDWVVDFWWVLLIALIAAATAIYLWRRYRKEGHILPRKPEPTPFEKAMTSLRHLKESKLWEQGLEKEYYTDLTEILRVYLQGRFGINAMEMTSREILGAFAGNERLKQYRADMRKLLDMADFVKFAKVRPLPEDNIRSFESVLNFVQTTKPEPVIEQDKQQGSSDAHKGSSTNINQTNGVVKSAITGNTSAIDKKGGEK